MKRLTSNKEASEMDILELVCNACHSKDGEVMHGDYNLDISARELAIKLLDKLAGIPNEFTCDEDFDERMAEYFTDYLRDGIDKVRIEGLISVFYWSFCEMVKLRERLKKYEDQEEQRQLLKPPVRQETPSMSLIETARQEE